MASLNQIAVLVMLLIKGHGATSFLSFLAAVLSLVFALRYQRLDSALTQTLAATLIAVSLVRRAAIRPLPRTTTTFAGQANRIQHRVQMLAVAGLPRAEVNRERFGVLSATQMHLGCQPTTTTSKAFSFLARSLVDFAPLFSGRAARWRAPAA